MLFLCLFPGHFSLMILGSESGRLGLQKQAFGVKGVAKTIFSQMLEFCWILGPILMCFGDLGTTFYDFGCDWECDWGLGGIWVRAPGSQNVTGNVSGLFL